ncbi:MAG: hypothetical protein WA710_21270, partial [Pseudolabrys sp.]
ALITLWPTDRPNASAIPDRSDQRTARRPEVLVASGLIGGCLRLARLAARGRDRAAEQHIAMPEVAEGTGSGIGSIPIWLTSFLKDSSIS